LHLYKMQALNFNFAIGIVDRCRKFVNSLNRQQTD